MARRALTLLVLVAIAGAACGGGTPRPGPRPTASPSPSPTASGTSTATPEPASTATPPPPPPSPTPLPPRTPTGGSARVIRQGPPDRPVVVLTFDAGADAGYAAQILDTLHENEIVAAFGMTGRWAERNPDLLRRIVAEGHELINHSYDHASFTGYSSRIAALSQEQRWSELDRTEAIIRQITGASTKPYFRPPFGDYDQTVLEDVFARGYAYSVMWSADSDGWRGDSADEIVTTCLAEAKPGAIYIFHVGSASQDAAALQRVIEGLRALGYGFVALSSVAPR